LRAWARVIAAVGVESHCRIGVIGIGKGMPRLLSLSRFVGQGANARFACVR
jgi:hypothetical protein